MLGEPYHEWVSLYRPELGKNWGNEAPELRNIGMIYNAFQMELSRLKIYLETELVNVRHDLKLRDDLKNPQNCGGLAQSQTLLEETNKENCSPKLPVSKQSRYTEEMFIDSPNTDDFSDRRPQYHQTQRSPILKKKYRTPPSPSLLDPSYNRNIEDDENIIDSSIIGVITPNIKNTKRKRRRGSTTQQGSAVLQSFIASKKKKDIDGTMPSMTISEMLNFIQNDDSDLDISTDSTIDNLDLPVELTDADNLASFADVKATDTDNLSSFRAKYDEVPKMELSGADEGARGKERKKLKGWSCRDCEDYYKALNLPPHLLEKKKNECSKHRYNNVKREETFEGFWDLTFGDSPKTQS